MTTSLLKFIRIVLMKGRKEKDGDFAATQVDVIPTTHMAPYGYGKTHGYTRIIRVVPQPLLLGATDTLKATLRSLTKAPSPSSLSLNDIGLKDIKASLRQQVRYHCRLNHIAAHTAMWTIGVEDFAELGRDSLVEKAREFFGLDPDQDDLFHEVSLEYDKISMDDDDNNNNNNINNGAPEDDDNPLTGLNNMLAEGSTLMSLLQVKASEETTDLLKSLDEVLLDEMKLSKNLTAWPCESFWTVGEPGNRLDLSPIIKNISQAMSPDCGAPFTSCFVKKDKCESRGDGECK